MYRQRKFFEPLGIQTFTFKILPCILAYTTVDFAALYIIINSDETKKLWCNAKMRIPHLCLSRLNRPYILHSIDISQIAISFISASSIFESELIKKIFQQDPSFCFRPFEATGCDQWNDTDGFETGSSENETLAFLFTKKNPLNPEFLHECGGHLPKNTNFNPKHQTEVFIHGYLDGACRSAWMRVSFALLRWRRKSVPNIV